MKKKLSLFVTMLMALVLVACGNTDTVFKLKNSSVVSTITVSHGEKEIEDITMNIEIDKTKDGFFDSLGQSFLEEKLANFSEEAEAIGDINMKDDDDDEKREVEITIDYEDINWEEFKETQLAHELLGSSTSSDEKPEYDILAGTLKQKGYKVKSAD